MKKITYIVLIGAILINAYLLFLWQPEEASVSCESQNVVYSYKPIYRIDKDKIEKNISDNEKEEIEAIMNRLSIVDIETIKETLNKEDEESVREAFKLMERRLPRNSYNRLREVYGEYINLDIIDNI